MYNCDLSLPPPSAISGLGGGDYVSTSSLRRSQPYNFIYVRGTGGVVAPRVYFLDFFPIITIHSTKESLERPVCS